MIQAAADSLDSAPAYVTIREFEVVAERHNVLGMPVLRKPFGEDKLLIVTSKVSSFSFITLHSSRLYLTTN